MEPRRYVASTQKALSRGNAGLGTLPYRKSTTKTGSAICAASGAQKSSQSVRTLPCSILRFPKSKLSRSLVISMPAVRLLPQLSWSR